MEGSPQMFLFGLISAPGLHSCSETHFPACAPHSTVCEAGLVDVEIKYNTIASIISAITVVIMKFILKFPFFDIIFSS